MSVEVVEVKTTKPNKIPLVTYCQDCLSARPIQKQDSAKWKEIETVLGEELYELVTTYNFSLREEIFRLKKTVRHLNKMVAKQAKLIKQTEKKHD